MHPAALALLALGPPAADTVAVLPLQVEGELDQTARGELEASLREGLGRSDFAVAPTPVDIDPGSCDAKCLEAARHSAGAEHLIRAQVTVESRVYRINVDVIGPGGEVVVSTDGKCEICGRSTVAELMASQGAQALRELELETVHPGKPPSPTKGRPRDLASAPPGPVSQPTPRPAAGSAFASRLGRLHPRVGNPVPRCRDRSARPSRAAVPFPVQRRQHRLHRPLSLRDQHAPRRDRSHRGRSRTHRNRHRVARPSPQQAKALGSTPTPLTSSVAGSAGVKRGGVGPQGQLKTSSVAGSAGVKRGGVGPQGQLKTSSVAGSAGVKRGGVGPQGQLKTK